ncbi:MAG TPA: ankyrin repeat domain-containing protein, partial [Turneriella sp.]|nr:ankyrin repeat domain-containing protein [Turneriella sp.]
SEVSKDILDPFLCRRGDFTQADVDITRLLVNGGADPNAMLQNRTALTCAIGRRESTDAVRVLLELGAEPNPVSDGGGNYVHLAAVGYKRKPMEDSGKIIDILIKHGVDFDTPNDEGNTPLHTAALDGNEYALREILKHKPKIDRKNNEGKTAYDLALKKKAKSETDAFERKLAAIIRNAARGPKLTEIGEIFSASEQQVDITGKGIAKVKAGEKLLVRTARGDYTLIAGENMHTKLKAKTSPAAAARLAKGDKVYRKN